MTNALEALSKAGVSVWLDDLSRDRLVSGSLADLAARDHVVGVTTNPTIFAAAITGSDAYDSQLQDLSARSVGVREALRALTTFDVRWACDVLRPVYDATGGVDGRVSIEVDARLAHDSAATIAEARALWWLVDRPNLFIKIPAVRQGIPAIAACLAEGISINVTLIFSLQRYDAVTGAFLDGMERARRAGLDLSVIGSGRLILRIPGRYRDRLAAGQDRDRRGGRTTRACGDRERPPRLPALRTGALRAAVGRAERRRSPAAAAVVGLDVGQGSGLSGHALRGRPGRARRGQHHARGHPAPGRRPRPGAR